MTNISIQDLQAGSNLIFDKESYLDELTDEESYLDELTDKQLLTNKGGSSPSIIATVVAFSASTAGSYAVSRFSRVVVERFF